MPQILIVLISFLFSACAQIVPTAQQMKSQNPPPALVKQQTSAAPTETLAYQPVYAESERHFLAPKMNKTVKFWIHYFSIKHKDRLERFVANGERYKPLIEQTFERYGLPKELYYVGLIESGYYNASKSRAGAVGPWQFMPSTARRYGLRVSRDVDERKNIFKATEAAALYFQDLYNIFGSWELALAAYNKGENGVIRRIRGANTRDYYELCAKKVLPKETRHYVPKVLAVMKILSRANAYNIQIKTWDNNIFEDAIKIELDKSLSIKKLAQKFNINTKVIRQLNQDLRNSSAVRVHKKSFELYLPGSAQTRVSEIKKYLATIKSNTRTQPVKTYATNLHIVRKNESLHSIAKRYGISVRTIRKLNHLSKSTIYPGQKIKVKGFKTSKIVSSYRVKKGDHLTGIANLFNLTTRELKAMNRLKSNKIMTGKLLKVPEHKKRYYTVKTGDFLGLIAKKHHIDLRQLIQLNGKNRRIYPGQKILLKLELI